MTTSVSESEKRPSKSASAAQGAIAGAVAGGVTRLVSAPFDLVKIRFQVQQAPISHTLHGAKYVSFLQSLRSIHAEEGIQSFWRGNLAATGLWISYSAVQFGTYRVLGSMWSPASRESHTTLVSSANGACAGVVATVITYPLDLFRTIFASQGVPKPYPTLQSLARHTLATRGIQGLYSGIGPTLFQIAPYMGLSFGIYTYLNRRVADHITERKRQTNVTWVFSYVGTGAVAGLVSKLIVYPLDTVKKRMQLRQVTRCPSYGIIPPYPTSWACCCDIIKREGVFGLYKGTLPSLLKSVVTHSSTFAVYEMTIAVLEHLQSD